MESRFLPAADIVMDNSEPWFTIDAVKKIMEAPHQNMKA
jgi:hypothetical protein